MSGERPTWDARDLLGYIEAQCRIARDAILDEHEGDTRRAVEQLAADAEQLRELVRSW